MPWFAAEYAIICSHAVYKYDIHLHVILMIAINVKMILLCAFETLHYPHLRRSLSNWNLWQCPKIKGYWKKHPMNSAPFFRYPTGPTYHQTQGLERWEMKHMQHMQHIARLYEPSVAAWLEAVVVCFNILRCVGTHPNHFNLHIPKIGLCWRSYLLS